MRHRVSGKRLGRDLDHRKALLKNLASSLVVHESLKTTYEKAKYLRSYIERLVTKAKIKDLNSVKYVKRKLFSDNSVRKMFDEIAPSYVSRKGGYTRITRVGRREGDNAEMAKIEWVDLKKTEEKPRLKNEEEGENLVKEEKPKRKKAAKKPVEGKEYE